MIQYIITEQADGRWYGLIPFEYGHDGNLNEIDCLQPTPEAALKSLMEQAESISHLTHEELIKKI